MLKSRIVNQKQKIFGSLWNESHSVNDMSLVCILAFWMFTFESVYFNYLQLPCTCELWWLMIWRLTNISLFLFLMIHLTLDNNEKARKRNVKHENYSISKLVSTLYYWFHLKFYQKWWSSYTSPSCHTTRAEERFSSRFMTIQGYIMKFTQRNYKLSLSWA